MLRHLGLSEHAHTIHTGLVSALSAGIRTGDLAQMPNTNPVSTMKFAEGVIKHLPNKEYSITVPEMKTPELPAVNKMMVSERKLPEETLGMDIFVDSDLAPPVLADKLLGIVKDYPRLRLVMISNRGTQVWPTGSTFTQCVNHYRCRIELGKEQKGGISEQDLLTIAAKITDKVRVCSLEMLLSRNGEKQYTLAQGQ
jgi:isocitrate dehydrogenase